MTCGEIRGSLIFVRKARVPRTVLAGVERGLLAYFEIDVL